MPVFNPSFNPMQVSLPRPTAVGGGGNPQGAYLGSAHPSGGPGMSQATMPAQKKPEGTIQAQAVRATGSGPYDQAFRQNLATYAGGQFARPGGVLGFNPTGNNTSMLGAQDSLLAQALGGQAARVNPPTPATPATTPKKTAATNGGFRIPGVSENWQGYGLGIDLGGMR